MLGDGRGRVGRAHADERALVRGGHHQHAAGHALGAEVALHEFDHLPAALADQGDDVDVRLGVAGHHAQGGGFTHAGTGHDAHALALAQRQQGVDRADADIERLVDARAVQRVGRLAVQGGKGFGVDVPLAVQRVAEGVHGPAEQGGAHGHVRRGGRVLDQGAGADAAHVRIGHEQTRPVAEADHLGRDGIVPCGQEITD